MMADPSPVQVEVPTVVVRRGDRVSTVPTWPMPLPGVVARTVELEAGEGDSLVLGPKRGARWEGGALALAVLTPGLFGFGLTMGILYRESRGFGLVIWGIGLLLIVGLIVTAFLSWYSSGTWVRFDRRSGLISRSRRPFGFRRSPRVFQTLPIAELACVQLIYNGFHSETTEIGEGDHKSYRFSRFHAYQMNLLLDRESTCRMNLANHSDWAWMRGAGGRLAGFLNIPLVDQLHHDG